MPLTTAEEINDGLAALGIGESILAAVTAMPPGPRKATDYGPILDIVKVKVLPFIDQVEADIKS